MSIALPEFPLVQSKCIYKRRCWFPRRLSMTCPFYQVLKSPPCTLLVADLINVVLLLFVEENRARLGVVLDLGGERVGGSELQESRVEYVLDTRWCIESVVVGADDLLYRVLGVLRVELLRWAVGLDVFQV